MKSPTFDEMESSFEAEEYNRYEKEHSSEEEEKSLDLRGLGKESKLLKLFPEVGTKHSLESVMEATGITTESSINTILWKFRSGYFSHLGEIDIRRKWGVLTRIK